MHKLSSSTDEVTTVGPLLMIACESCIGFIGGGNITSSSFSTSVGCPCCCWSCSNLLCWSVFDLSRSRFIFVLCDNGCSSSAVIIVANLKFFSEPFFRKGRSFGTTDDDDATAVDVIVLSTFPWDSFRSGGGNHFRLYLKKNWREKITVYLHFEDALKPVNW